MNNDTSKICKSIGTSGQKEYETEQLLLLYPDTFGHSQRNINRFLPKTYWLSYRTF